MPETLTACPRCGQESEPAWTFCPHCSMALDARGGELTTLSDRIRYVRRESATRSRRAVVVRALAITSVLVAILLIVGGGILLFHPAMIPSLFEPPATTPIEIIAAGEPHVPPSASSEAVAPPVWVDVPAGNFLYGPKGNAKEWQLPAFQIMKYEVTNGQWMLYLRDSRERLRTRGRYQDSVPVNWDWDPETDEPPMPRHAFYDRPVTYITWEQARDFCEQWLALQPHWPGCEGARLPTGQEWEKAARGAEDDRRYPWGDEFFYVRDGQPIPRCNTRETGILRPLDVREYEKKDLSPFGVVGMGGNVAEFVGWTPQNLQGYRGGAYNTDQFGAWIWDETKIVPHSDHSWAYVGFRAARSVEEPK